MISFRQHGNFKNTERFFTRLPNVDYKPILDYYGKEGVRALAEATPVDTGLTADSWEYLFTISKGHISISWNNTNAPDGVPIAILLQYGHGTRNGGYVKGRDYINPALKPIFDSLAQKAWKEITSL